MQSSWNAPPSSQGMYSSRIALEFLPVVRWTGREHHAHLMDEDTEAGWVTVTWGCVFHSYVGEVRSVGGAVLGVFLLHFCLCHGFLVTEEEGVGFFQLLGDSCLTFLLI